MCKVAAALFGATITLARD